ncbi:hypothetical protein [Arthrobacter sp. zg-Y1143]|uniref:hypothetical protein n=1 Tax=Arthrobacter sp. zg-Y1143 TaxID=3049065 RepID=UPI0024C284A3|nr:hypothetical protein [Arthrobacter sp. zg-Y1143]MDK1326204.1 hypothetical protein [Arthrobacter sp. zg-Y1143]
MDPEAAVTLGVAAFGLLVMVPGLLVYSGRFRHYRAGLNILWTGEPALASTYIGAAFALFPVTQFVIQPNVYPLIGLVFLPLYFLIAVIGILGNFWMPRPLQPKWIKEEKPREKQEQTIRAADPRKS